MKGFYFLIGSFAAGEIIRLLWKRFRDPFGGPKGIKRIPDLGTVEIGGLTIDFYEPVTYYYFALAVVSVSLFILWRIERSPIGSDLSCRPLAGQIGGICGRRHPASTASRPS